MRKDLTERNLLSKKDRSEVASDLVLLTSSADNATIKDVENAIYVIKKLITSDTNPEVNNFFRYLFK